MTYYDKYIKYKHKYYILKNQLGKGDDNKPYKGKYYINNFQYELYGKCSLTFRNRKTSLIKEINKYKTLTNLSLIPISNYECGNNCDHYIDQIKKLNIVDNHDNKLNRKFDIYYSDYRDYVPILYNFNFNYDSDSDSNEIKSNKSILYLFNYPFKHTLTSFILENDKEYKIKSIDIQFMSLPHVEGAYEGTSKFFDNYDFLPKFMNYDNHVVFKFKVKNIF